MNVRHALPALALALAACGDSAGPSAAPTPTPSPTTTSASPTPVATPNRRTGPPSLQWRPISVTLDLVQCPSPAPTTQPHPDDTALVPTAESCLDLYEAEFTATRVKGVDVVTKRADAHLVNVRLHPEEAGPFVAMTREHAPKKTHFAIVFGGRAIYTPVVESPQGGGDFLAGVFTTKAEADKLAAELRVLV